MKYIQDNGKIKLCETDNMDHLVRLTQALNENNIPYETRLKKATFINNLFFLIFYGKRSNLSMGMKFSQGNFPELLNDKLMTSTIV
jgi:hypothetical protein